MKVNLEKHFDKAEKNIINACDNSLKELENFLKGQLRKIIQVRFNKITGTLLKSVQARIKKESKNNKYISVGVNKDAFYSLFLDRGTGMRRHKKTGKKVGKIKSSRFIKAFYQENKENIKNIIENHLKRI